MKVLLVDDDTGSLRGMQIALKMLKHLCDAYNDPYEAVKSYRNHAYDLVITDINMPNIKEGVEQISQASSETAHGTQNAVDSVQNIAAVAQETSASTQSVTSVLQHQKGSMSEINVNAGNLAKLATELEGILKKFRV